MEILNPIYKLTPYITPRLSAAEYNKKNMNYDYYNLSNLLCGVVNLL